MSIIPSGLCAAVLIAAAAPAQAGVSLSFANQGSYTDANINGDFNTPGSRAVVYGGLRSIFQRLGNQLRPDLNLAVTILDVNLAGEYEPFRSGANSVRVLRGSTGPKIKLRYVLSSRSKVLASGEELVLDQMYQSSGATRLSSDPLRYERAMLEDWFARRFYAYVRQG